MNYLAHLALAQDTPESQLGNLLGDFRKGLKLETLPPAIVAGIDQHQRIDQFTDTHPLVRQAKQYIQRDRRRFAGVFLDVFYDHYLSIHWSRYFAIPRQDFISNCYQVLQSHQEILPDRLRRATPHLIAQDWLGNYATVEGIALTLERMSQRLRRPNPLHEGVVDLVDRYDELERSFLAFFPLLLDYSANWNNDGK